MNYFELRQEAFRRLLVDYDWEAWRASLIFAAVATALLFFIVIRRSKPHGR